MADNVQEAEGVGAVVLSELDSAQPAKIKLAPNAAANTVLSEPNRCAIKKTTFVSSRIVGG